MSSLSKWKNLWNKRYLLLNVSVVSGCRNQGVCSKWFTKILNKSTNARLIFVPLWSIFKSLSANNSISSRSTFSFHVKHTCSWPVFFWMLYWIKIKESVLDLSQHFLEIDKFIGNKAHIKLAEFSITRWFCKFQKELLPYWAQVNKIWLWSVKCSNCEGQKCFLIQEILSYVHVYLSSISFFLF